MMWILELWFEWLIYLVNSSLIWRSEMELNCRTWKKNKLVKNPDALLCYNSNLICYWRLVELFLFVDCFKLQAQSKLEYDKVEFLFTKSFRWFPNIANNTTKNWDKEKRERPLQVQKYSTKHFLIYKIM